ncbi:MAG: hypothetical protein ABI759_23010 [Candidatus Solibacter sp.]
MSTLKQFAANRRNSQKSTGPKTAAGKSASSMNAFKTGLHAKSAIIRGEKADDLQTLIDEYYAYHHPASPELRSILDDLIACEWQLRRLLVTEAELEKYLEDNLFNAVNEDHPRGKVANNSYNSFAALQRRLESARRARARALDSLREHTDCPIRPYLPEAAPSQPTHILPPTTPDHRTPSPAASATPSVTPSPKSTSPKIGFVPQTSPSAPPAAPPSPESAPMSDSSLQGRIKNCLISS